MTWPPGKVGYLEIEEGEKENWQKDGAEQRVHHLEIHDGENTIMS